MPVPQQVPPQHWQQADGVVQRPSRSRSRPGQLRSLVSPHRCAHSACPQAELRASEADEKASSYEDRCEELQEELKTAIRAVTACRRLLGDRLLLPPANPHIDRLAASGCIKRRWLTGLLKEEARRGTEQVAAAAAAWLGTGAQLLPHWLVHRAAASELELGELCGEIKLAHRERDQVDCDG